MIDTYRVLEWPRRGDWQAVGEFYRQSTQKCLFASLIDAPSRGSSFVYFNKINHLFKLFKVFKQAERIVGGRSVVLATS